MAKEIRTLKFPGDLEPREIVDAKAREQLSQLSEDKDYSALDNKPKINGVELSGNLSNADLGLESPTDEQVGTAVNAWLAEHPEATTTVQDGSITAEKLSEDVRNQMKGGTADVSYKWAARGYMRKQVRDFQGWAHCVQYDPELDLAVGIVISGTGSHTNAQPWYRVTIDPKSGYMSDYEEIVVLDTDGVTVFVPETGYMGNFKILSDGTYMLIDGKQNIYTSPDKGKTLVRKLQYAFSNLSDDSMFGLTELSNGRLLVGHGGQKNTLYYSDNKGQNWTSVTPDNSGLGAQAYPEGRYVPFEPCFIEIGGGKILCVARASMNAYKTYADGILTVQESAVISRSEDYGATWSAWEWSTSLTDMTANNMKAVVKDGKVHAVYGSRYHGFVDDFGKTPHFALRYASATLEDAYADKWGSIQVIDVGHWDIETASYSSDCGYPSLFAADGNLFAIHYNSDGTGSAFGANWRLCVGSQGVAQIAPVTSDGKGSTVVGYTQAVVDALFQGLLSKINDLYLKIGELPEQGEIDGSYPVLDGLVAWFEPGDSTQYESDGYTIKSKVGEYTAYSTKNSNHNYITAQAPTSFAGNMIPNGIMFQDDLSLADYGITNELTMEFVLDQIGNQNHVLLIEHKDTGSFNALNTSILSRPNNFGGDYVTVAVHVVYVFTTEATKIYVNGNYATDGTTLTTEQFATAHPLCKAYGGAVGGVRLYNRALTEEEIQNNYKYASTLTTFGMDYFS